MYGDTDVMHRRADQLREQAVDLRVLADQLMARTETTGWVGRAADSMRARVDERAAHLREAAGRHDTAADSLDRHAQEVATLVEAISDVERRVERLLADARTRVARVEQAQDLQPDVTLPGPDPDDVRLLAFTPPPPGHRDWLAVELPGL